MSIIEQYMEELQKDMYIDELNVTQVAYTLPALKHKWVARLIRAKTQINLLEKRKKDCKDSIITKLNDSNISSNLKISPLALERSITNDDSFKKTTQKIDEEIEDLKLIILYLEKIENIFKNMTYDIKNIIDLNKLETT